MKIINTKFNNDEIKEVNDCMIRNDIDLYKIPVLLKNEIKKYNHENNINISIFKKLLFKQSNNLKHTKYNSSFKNFKELISDANVTEQKYDFHTSKLSYNYKGKEIFILQREREKTFDIWYFKNDFNKEQSLKFIQNWDNRKRGIKDNTNKI